MERAKVPVVLTVRSYGELADGEAAALEAEARRLLGFAAADAATHEVRIAPITTDQ